MAKPDSFIAVNDAAGDKFFAMLSAADEGKPATVATPEPPEDTPASDAAGTTPTNDDGEQRDDQDGSGAAGEVVESEASTPTDSVSTGFDPQKTLEKYKTPEEKEKALVESQRTLLERGEENKRLKAELEALKSGKTSPDPKPEAPAAAELGYDEWLVRLHAGKPEELTPQEVRVQQEIASLGEEKKGLKAIETRAIEIQTKASETEAAMARLQTIIEAQEADLKAEPDDYALEKRIEANRAKLEKAGQDLLRLELNYVKESNRYRDAATAFNGRILEVDKKAQGLHSHIRRTKEEAVTQAETSKALNSEWETGLKKLFDTDLKGDGFSKAEQEDIAAWLEKSVNDSATKTGRLPADLYAWQKEQKAVFDRARTRRTEIERALISRKTSDLPSKPRNNVVSDTPKSGKTSSFKQTLKAAESKFDRAFNF